jgi:ABC-type transport system involved in cytochrome c biogenesis permease subunit
MTVTRALVLTALVWVPFLSIFGFAAMGDRSHPHLAFHVVALTLLLPAAVLAQRVRRSAGSRTQRAAGRVLSVSVPLAVVGHVLELAVAVARFAADGWVDRDTSDLWVSGPHQWAAGLTVPAMMVSMLAALLLLAAVTVGRRRRVPEDAAAPLAR